TFRRRVRAPTQQQQRDRGTGRLHESRARCRRARGVLLTLATKRGHLGIVAHRRADAGRPTGAVSVTCETAGVRVLVCPDKFAGTLAAPAAADAIAAGWRDAAPADEVAVRPLADGGPGFLDAL